MKRPRIALSKVTNPGFNDRIVFILNPPGLDLTPTELFKLHAIGIIVAFSIGCPPPVFSCAFFAGQIQDLPQAKKHATPDKSKQREMESVIRELFADQFKDRSLEGQSKLADDLLETAQQTKDDLVGQFVLFSKALEVAISSGNIQSACQSSEQLIRLFDVDATKIRRGLIEGLAKTIKDPDDWDQLKSHVKPLINDTVKKNEFKPAEQLLQSLNKGARRINDTFLVETTLLRLKSIKVIAREYANTKPHFKKLKLNPANPVANQAVGEFRCFWKQDFEAGLPNLAKGTDDQIRKLASDELKGFSDNPSRIRIADQWWGIRKKLRGVEAKAVVAHAVVLYRASVEEAQGIDKKRIESRIAEFDALALAGLPANIKAVFGKPWRVTWENGQPTWEKTVFNADGSMRSFAKKRNWDNTFVIDNNMIRALSATKEFVFTVEFYGKSLVCRKFDAKTGKLLDRGTGILLNE